MRSGPRCTGGPVLLCSENATRCETLECLLEMLEDREETKIKPACWPAVTLCRVGRTQLKQRRLCRLYNSRLSYMHNTTPRRDGSRCLGKRIFKMQIFHYKLKAAASCFKWFGLAINDDRKMPSIRLQLG